MSTAARTSSVIVVGVDGSAASKAALRWAIAEATRRDCVVRAVAVSPTPELMPARSLAMEPRGMRFPVHDPAENARRLATLIEEASAGIGAPATVVPVTVTGEPASELVKSAADADLLVLGGHEHGGLSEVFLGSVAADALRHAPCPVVIMPPHLAKDW